MVYIQGRPTNQAVPIGECARTGVYGYLYRGKPNYVILQKPFLCYITADTNILGYPR